MKAYEALQKAQEISKAGMVYDSLRIEKPREESTHITSKEEYVALMKAIESAAGLGLFKINVRGFNAIDKKVEKMIADEGYTVIINRGMSNVHDENTIVSWRHAKQGEIGDIITKRNFN